MTHALSLAFYATTVCLNVACANPAAANAWDLIMGITYKETVTDTSWAVEKTIPEALRAQADSFRITGYYVPVEAQGFVTQFLLVPDPADCPFCGTSGYGPSLEVNMKRPVNDMPEATRVTVEGTLNFDNSPETYRAVYLTDGVMVGGQ